MNCCYIEVIVQYSVLFLPRWQQCGVPVLSRVRTADYVAFLG